MDNKQIASAYAVAKILGYKESFDNFKAEYSKIYNETIKELNPQPIENGKVDATANPFRRTY